MGIIYLGRHNHMRSCWSGSVRIPPRRSMEETRPPCSSRANYGHGLQLKTEPLSPNTYKTCLETGKPRAVAPKTRPFCALAPTASQVPFSGSQYGAPALRDYRAAIRTA